MARKRKSKEVPHRVQYPASGALGKSGERLLLLAILLVSSILILANLGNVYLWGDEAATALISKTILHAGLPMGSDGLNCYCQMYGKEVNDQGIWIWHPWLPFYVLAGFFAVFGMSTFVARLPFALFGIGVVLIAYLYGKSLWRTTRAGVFAATLLMISVPFLLLVRQCRYYSPAIFFTLVGLYAYSAMLKERRHAAWLLGASAFLLFHTHYIYCAALLATTIIHSLIFRRDKAKTVLITSAIATAACIPWIMIYAGVGHEISEFGSFSARVPTNMHRFGIQIVSHVFTPVLFGVVALVVIAWNHNRHGRPVRLDRETAENLALLVIFVLVCIVALGLTCQSFFFRYLGPLIPVFCLISAYVLEASTRIHRALPILVIAVLIWRGQMPAYLSEITHDYDGPNEGIVNYLNAHAAESDIVAVNHENLPIIFYTGLRVVCAVSGRDCSDAKNAQWIVLRQGYCTKAELDMTHLLLDNMRKSKYLRITLDYPDTPFENREDPERHYFRTQDAERRVTIYHRIEN